MIKDYLDEAKIKVLDYFFTHFEKAISLDDLLSVKLGKKNSLEKTITSLLEENIIECHNSEKPFPERTYLGNLRSKIYMGLFNIEVELNERYFEKMKEAKSKIYQAKR